MSTKKILKFYLITTLSLSSLAVFSFNDEFREYLSASYASVLDFQHVEKKPALAVTEDENINKNVTDPFYRENPAKILFAINRKRVNSLVGAGTKNVNFTNLVFTIGDTKAKLNDLTFTIKGVDSGKIENAYLAHEKEIISTAQILENKIKFSNIGFEFKPNTRVTLPVRLDLGENLQVGEIMTLDIEKSDDVNFEFDGRNYGLNGHYPIKAGHLSIAKIR